MSRDGHGTGYGGSMSMRQSDAPRVKLRWSRYHAMMIAVPADHGVRDRLLACLGALVGIAATGLLVRSLIGTNVELPLLVAPMGAAAVLLFAVPASPLAQPYAALVGNIVSAVVGVAAARLIPDQMVAAGVAVAGAIGAMTALRCLHPPGGAIALTAVFGGAAVKSAGYDFAIVPVGIDAALLVAAAWGFHRFSGHSYPHVVKVLPTIAAVGDFRREDLEQAIAEYPDVLDVDPADLENLLHAAEHHAARRRAYAAR